MMKQIRKTALYMALMLAIFFAAALPPAHAAYYVKQVKSRFMGVAGETLATGQAVCVKDSDGYIYKADANDAALRPAVGVVGSKTGVAGATVEVITEGRLTGWSSLAEITPGYLSETAGAVTQSSPSWSQQVAQAMSSTDYYFSFRNYLDTSALTSLGVLTGQTPFILEGATVDDYETSINVVDPTADRTQYIQNRSGYYQYDSAPSLAAVALTPGAAVTLTVGQAQIYTLTPTDNEDSTITFSGAGTFGDVITILVTTTGTADEVLTFHATLVSSTGTLTAGTAAGKFYTIRFISDGTHWYEISRTAVQT